MFVSAWVCTFISTRTYTVALGRCCVPCWFWLTQISLYFSARTWYADSVCDVKLLKCIWFPWAEIWQQLLVFKCKIWHALSSYPARYPGVESHLLLSKVALNKDHPLCIRGIIWLIKQGLYCKGKNTRLMVEIFTKNNYRLIIQQWQHYQSTISRLQKKKKKN